MCLHSIKFNSIDSSTAMAIKSKMLLTMIMMGDTDLYFTSQAREENKLYSNDGDGTFMM